MRASTVRSLAAVLAVAAWGFTSACSGSGSGSAEDGGDRPRASAKANDGKPDTADEPAEESPSAADEDRGGGPTGTLSKAELDRAAITTSDVKGYTVDKPSASDLSGAGEGGARPSRCASIAALITGVPRPEPSAVVYRRLGSEDQSGDKAGLILFEILSSHEGTGAQRLITDLRKAVSDCAGGFTIRGGEGAGEYPRVKALPKPDAGDDAMAYEVSGDLEGEEVPLVFTVVRQGSTVATFYSMNLMDGAKAEIPVSVVTAQADRL